MHCRVLGTSGVAHRSAVRQSTASLRLRLLLLLQQKDNARPQAYGCVLARSGLAVSYAYNQIQPTESTVDLQGAVPQPVPD